MTKGGVISSKSLKFFIFLNFILGFFCTQEILAFSPGSLLISEVQTTGGSGKSNYDYIKIYNSTNEPFNLNGLRLVKRTKNGVNDINIKSWSNDVFVPPLDYYLWANSGDNFAASLNANASTTQTLSDDNAIAIRYGKEDEGTIIDSLAWGDCQNDFIEEQAFNTNPSANEILVRKENLDTNNNLNDFFLFLPEVANNSLCGNGKKEENEECDDNNLENNDGCNSSCLEEIILPTTPIIISTSTKDVIATTTPTTTSTILDINASNGFFEPDAYYGEVVINEFMATPNKNENEWIELYNNGNREINLNNWTIEDGNGVKTVLTGKIGLHDNDKFFIIEKPKGSLNNNGDALILKNNKEQVIDQVFYGDWQDKETNAPFSNLGSSLARKTDGFNSKNNKIDFLATDQVTKKMANIIFVKKLEKQEPEKILVKSIEKAEILVDNDNKSVKTVAATTKSKIKRKSNLSTAIFKIKGTKKVGEKIVFDATNFYDENLSSFLFKWNFGDDGHETGYSVNHTFKSAGDYNIILTIQGEENEFIKNKTISIKPEAKKVIKKSIKVKKKKASSKSNFSPVVSVKSINELFSLKNNQNLKISGLVASVPGSISKSYFYLLPIFKDEEEIDDNFKNLKTIKIYNSKKLFPSLKEGDYIEINGQFSLTTLEKRIKTKLAKDIKIIDRQNLPEIKTINCLGASKAETGEIIATSGSVSSKKGNYLYIDDGQAELKIGLKTGTDLKTAQFNLGDKVNVKGVVENSGEEKTLFPRNKNDISVEEIDSTNTEKLNQNDFNVEANNNSLMKYTVIILVVVGVFVGVVVFKIKHK